MSGTLLCGARSRRAGRSADLSPVANLLLFEVSFMRCADADDEARKYWLIPDKGRLSGSQTISGGYTESMITLSCDWQQQALHDGISLDDARRVCAPWK